VFHVKPSHYVTRKTATLCYTLNYDRMLYVKMQTYVTRKAATLYYT